MTKRTRILLGTFILLLTAASLAMAQEYWAKKPFNEWSSEELKRFMTDSPWVKNVTMATQAPSDNMDMGMSGRGGGGGGESGGETSGEAGGGGGGGRGGRRGGGGGGGFAAGTITISVSWQSALPVRQANVRSRMNHSGQVPADAKEYLDAGDSDYVILISGMPQSIARQALANPEKVKKSYIRSGKHEIAVSGIATAQRGSNTDILMKFSKAEPIRIEDGEVEVDAKLGMFEVKKKFKLKEMVFNGKLEL